MTVDVIGVPIFIDGLGRESHCTVQLQCRAWRGSGVAGWNRIVSCNGFVEDSERLVQEVCRTTECDVNLLECLLPASFLLKGLKTAMMIFHDRLLRIQHQAINSCHRCPPHSCDGDRTVTDL